MTSNTATATGGGIRAEGYAYVTIDEPQIWIANNEAQSGYGGGIAAIGGGAHVHIGSPGYKIANYVGVVYGNTAQYGGGIAGVALSGPAGSGEPEFDIVAADPNHPVRIEQNRASHTGGGIYLGAYEDNAGGGGTLAKMDGAQIDGNAAQEGSGIYADTDSSTLYTGGGDVWFYASDCATGIECNSVSNNRAVDDAGNPTAGSAILIQSYGALNAQQLIMRGNQGAHAIRVADSLGEPLGLDGCLLADNTVTGELVTLGNASATIKQCTFAHNTIGGPSVLHSQADLSLTDSIFAQGALTTLSHTGSGNLSIEYVLSGETDSLATGQYFLFADPSFVDPDHGDFHLLPNSLAIDFAPPVAGDDRDLDNLPRDQDMPNVPNLYGDRDLGAYERQSRYCGAADSIFCNGFDNP
jgi:predicted outer membrane repeat protein